MRRKSSYFVLLVSLALAVTVSFQGCGNVGFNGSNSGHETNKVGGEGFDGKPYRSYGRCSHEVDVADQVVVAADYRSASITRENCRDLSPGRPVAIADLNFSLRDPSVFELNGKVFDEETLAANQKITAAVCRGRTSSQNVETNIWTEIASPGSLFGRVNQSNGMGTGALLVEPPTTANPNRYISVAGQSSALDLDLSGSLTYALNGGPNVSTQTLTCNIQPPPLALVQSVAAFATGTGTTYTFNSPPTGSGNLLVIGLSIYNTSGPCTASIADNAGNNYTSAGAYTRDANSGSAEVWYAPDSQAAGQTVTIRLNGACSGVTPVVYFAEFSGVALVNPLEGSPAIANDQSASLLVRAPTLSTASARSVVFSVTTVQHDVLSIASGNAFQALGIVDGDNAAYYIATAQGSYAAAWNQNNVGTFGASTVAFRAKW